MAKHIATGNKLAIKFHRHAEARDKSVGIITRLSERYVARLAHGLPATEVIFDDAATHPDHQYAMVRGVGEASS